MQELTLKLQACPFTMLRPDLPGVLLGALVNLRVLDLDLASFAPPPPMPVEGEPTSALLPTRVARKRAGHNTTCANSTLNVDPVSSSETCHR